MSESHSPIERSDRPSPGIRVKGAVVTYGGERLFDGLDVQLEGGRWTCLLGASGVGKSTLLRLILGLVDGGARSVTCSDGGPVAGRAAFMAQRDLLLPWLTVLDNVLLGIRLRGKRGVRKAAEGRARTLLAAVGLADHAEDRPDTLSSGMRQRVAIARTLMEDRPISLLDEPFSALDVLTRVRLQGLAGRLLDRQTVLLVTHDPLEALRLGHRIHVMSGVPATIDEALVPAGEPPREVDDPMVLETQGDLLRRLAGAAI